VATACKQSRRGRPNDRHIGVRRHLDSGHSCGKYDQRSQEHAEACNGCRGNEPESPDAHDDQASDHRPLVADDIHELAAGIAENKVGREEGELHQHRLSIGEFEDALQVGNYDVVEAGQKTHDEEKRDCYLYKHYREQNAVAQLGRIAALSRSSLHRLFRQQTGMTTSGYVTQLRIGNACALLLNTEKPIFLIADQVGYRNLANFNRQFKETKGQTPRQFRAAFNSRGLNDQG
jgi:AraC-like DNA-binding protein